jgi:hypothetical protein
MFVVYYAYPSATSLFLLSSLVASVMWAFTCLSGAVLPFGWRSRDIYSQSGLTQYRVGGLPIITIFGVLGIVFWIFADYVLLSVPALGIAGANATFSVVFLVALVALFAGLYFWYRYANKRKGIDISLIFKSIPPE